MYLNSSSVKEGLLGQQVAGYAQLVDELENLMWPILCGDEEYFYELNQQGLEKTEYPTSNDAKPCFDYVNKINKKYKIISKRFYRFGLMPIVPTSLNLITRTQKYEKFKNRIKAQSLKYLDLFGEELIEELRKKRQGKLPSETREAEYSKIYREYLKTKNLQNEDLEDDVLAFIETN
jgi:hypothetical protein